LTRLEAQCQLVQAWTHDRTLYLGHVLQKMLRGYTDAAVSITSNLVTIISRFAVQVPTHPLNQSCYIQSINLHLLFEKPNKALKRQ